MSITMLDELINAIIQNDRRAPRRRDLRASQADRQRAVLARMRTEEDWRRKPAQPTGSRRPA
jgi:hypothetical protein